MKPWIQRTLFALFGASLTFGALAACSYRYHHHGWNASAEERQQHRDRMIDHVAKRLDLNAEQKQRLATLADKVQQQRAAMVAGTPDPRAALRGLVAGDKFDRAKAQALVAEKMAAVTTGSPEVIAALGDFFDNLNPAQQARVREFMERRRGWWRRG
jgi:Spy/CpxP family protein refolding chaperone